MPRLRLFSILLAASAIVFASGPARGLGVGDEATPFTLVDTTGASHSLSDYEGMIRVLYFVGWG